MSTNRLTIIILTHRNDDRFEKSLRSALFADEVIVMTFGQVKITVPPSEQVKVITGNQDMIDDFSAARNYALQAATSEWVLFLDSDEEVSLESIQVIKETINKPGLAGVYIQRVDVFAGRKLKYGETGQHWLLRLTTRQVRYQRPVHEVAIVEGVKIKAPIVILHYPHPTITEFWQSVSRYSWLEANHRVENQMPFSFWQLMLYPPAKFMVSFFWKRGFLDGWRGYVYAVMMSLHSLMVRIFWYEAAQKQK